MLQDQWTLLASRPVSDQRIFLLRHDRYRLETTGAEQDFVVLETPDWVNVVPITADGQVVFIRQYRHGIRKVSLEIPGGMIDRGEDPQEAGIRELAEETGYVPERVRLLGRLRPNPAIQNNFLYCYVAEGCRLAGGPALDPLECIETVPVPLADVPAMIRSGQLDHGMVLNALAFLGLVQP